MPLTTSLSTRWCVLLATASVFPLGALAGEAKRPLELEDQFERRVKLSSLFVGTVVIVGGDERETDERIAEWAKAMPNVRMFGLANLRGLPFFVPRNSVRGSLRDALPKTQVLLDWDGTAYDRLGFPDDSPVVVHVYNERKELVLRLESRPTPDAVRAVERALGPKPSP